MNTKADFNDQRARSPALVSMAEEWRRIPMLAKGIAALVPVCVIGVFIIVVFLRSTAELPSGPDSDPAEVTIRLLVMTIVPVIVSVVVALWVLLVGYVYADSGRRGMSRPLWVLLVIFVPNALGFILYFILRRPVPADCPACGRGLDSEVAYCPGCGKQVAESCSQCSHPVGLADAFCSSCGHNLKNATHPEAAN